MEKALSRRSVLKVGIATSLAFTAYGLFSQKANAAKGNDRTGDCSTTVWQSPYTTPFVELLFIPSVKEPVVALSPL